jgi:dipeptidase E
MGRAGQIVAMGGGGFSMEPDNPLLDDYVLSLTGKNPARVCFVPTASADAATYLVKFYRTLGNRALTSDLTLFDPVSVPRRPARSADIADYLSGFDVIYVGGGNTANALALWRVHGVDRALAAAHRAGAVLCGVSAGMICWFEASCTDSFGGVAALNDGLGFLGGSACPHYDGEAERRPTYQRLIREGLPAGYACDDGAALHFEGTELRGVVSSRPKAGAYHVSLRAGELVEEALPVRYLGG